MIRLGKRSDAYKKQARAPGLQVNGYREDPRGWRKTIFAQEDTSYFKCVQQKLKFIDDNIIAEFGGLYKNLRNITIFSILMAIAPMSSWTNCQ